MEVVSSGDLDALDDLVAPDYVDHGAPPGLPPGLEGLKASMAAFRAGFPDAHVTVEDQVAEGDMVASRITWGGTFEGEFMGMEPTGKKAEVGGITIHRLAGGKLAEEWDVHDMMGMMQQLGVIPEQ